MTDPQIVCPNCHTEIRLTESLAAPLIAETRRQFEAQLAAREADFGLREAGLKKTQEDLTKLALNDSAIGTSQLRTSKPTAWARSTQHGWKATCF
jgi:hypothetical protein